MDIESGISGLEKRLKVAECHIEAGRILSFYQVSYLVLQQHFLHVLIARLVFAYSISSFSIILSIMAFKFLQEKRCMMLSHPSQMYDIFYPYCSTQSPSCVDSLFNFCLQYLQFFNYNKHNCILIFAREALHDGMTSFPNV